MKGPRTLRAQVALTAGLAAAVAIVVLVIAFNIVIARSLAGEVDSKLRSQAARAATTTTVLDDRVTVRESPDDEAIDRRVWIFSGGRTLIRAAGPAGLQLQARALVGRDRVFVDLPSEKEGGRLYAKALTHAGRQLGTVVVGQSMNAYDRSTDLALGGSVGLGAVLLAAVLALTWIATGRALAPVRGMARTAADWTANDLDRRFGHAPRPDELGELARTFDDLLDRVGASLRHEQRLSAELSHELRTPLARIAAQAELLLTRERGADERREAITVVLRSAREMEQILATLMAAARADAGLDRGRSPLAPTLERLTERWSARVGDVPAGLHVGVDADMVERIVSPLLDNAARAAREDVVVQAAQRDGAVAIDVLDDGPGIDEADRDAIFEPGRRGTAAHASGGAGLGLALARRLARASGGDVTVEAPLNGGGAHLRVTLPA